MKTTSLLKFNIIFNIFSAGVVVGFIAGYFINPQKGKDIPERMHQEVYTKPKNFLGTR